jgi:hypothetical protein
VRAGPETVPPLRLSPSLDTYIVGANVRLWIASRGFIAFRAEMLSQPVGPGRVLELEILWPHSASPHGPILPQLPAGQPD